MRTTLNIDDEPLQQTRSPCGIEEKTALVREELKALIERESAYHLARFGGSDPPLKSVPRRHPETDA